jgi:AcrR family transcriptional regulator
MNRRSASDTRRTILEATRRIFAEHGYEQASMRSIAQAAGVSVGGLYLYFKSKEELYRVLTEEWVDELDALTRAALAGEDDPRTAIATFIRVSIDYATERREMILLQGKELGLACGSELKRKFFRERRALIADIITMGIATGTFRDCDTEETARVIFSILRGFIFSILVEEEALFSPEACADLVLNGLIRRNGE